MPAPHTSSGLRQITDVYRSPALCKVDRPINIERRWSCEIHHRDSDDSRSIRHRDHSCLGWLLPL